MARLEPELQALLGFPTHTCKANMQVETHIPKRPAPHELNSAGRPGNRRKLPAWLCGNLNQSANDSRRKTRRVE